MQIIYWARLRNPERSKGRISNDQLLPDFGMSSDGLLLDVGARGYHINLGQDLNILVTNTETGRVTKSLPKAKSDEDPELRVTAETKFNYIRKNIKKVAKQQSQRMEEAAVVGRSWPYPQWKILFLEHPLLTIMGQSLIWQRSSAKGKKLGSFRISEDLTLIDAQDEEVSPSETEMLELWHPVKVDDEEYNDWSTHLADYDLTPIVDQLALPRHKLEGNEKEATSIQRFKGAEITTADARRLLDKWGYVRSDVNDSSYSDVWHKRFNLTGWTVSVEFDNFRIFNEYNEPVTLEHFEAYKSTGGAQKLSKIPDGIVAMLIDQGKMLHDLS